MTGVVADPKGAVIPNASVSATNKSTNFERTVATTGEDVYVISNLPVGNYEVKISAQNFETKVSESLVSLKIGQTVTLDASLKVGTLGISTDLSEACAN